MDVDSTKPSESSTATSMDVDSSLRFIAAEPYTDDGHRQKDEAVTQELDLYGLKWGPSSSIAELLLALQAVVRCDDRLDRKYLDFPSFQLVRESPSLQSMLIRAVQTRSYRDIRKLVILQAPTPTGEPISENQLTVLKSSLTAAYQGRADDAFLKYLQRNNEAFQRRHYYGRFCSIVQSSGTGKTRLLLQLAARGVCVLYVNIRSPDDIYGYPPRDNTPADILTRPYVTEEEYRVQCFAFFATIFKVLPKFLQKKLDWYKDMCTIGSPARTSFFVDLEREYANVEKEIPSSSVGRMIVDMYYSKMVARQSFPRAQENEPRLVIALDDAHVLYEKEWSRSFLRAAVLLQTIKAYSEANDDGIWVVFVSTTSKVVHFPSPQALSSSARVPVEGQLKLLFPPFTQLGWDQNAPALGNIPPDEVAKAEHIIQYGRPLGDGYSLKQLLQLATRKLCGKAAFDPRDVHQAFAVLAQRFGLDIAFGHRNAVGYVETLVGSYLRMCVKTTEDRIWVYSTYPSEPILSCAAASLLHGDNQSITLRQLENMVNDGVVEIGQIGELASRLLWLLAKDLFVRTKVHAPKAKARSEVKSEFEQVLPDCQPIPVVEFLEFVFGPTIWTAAPRARNEFRNAYVNFSHWVSMDFDIRRSKGGVEQLPIEEWTLCHWERTSAVQCCHNQPLIDKVIPMYFKAQTHDGPAGMSHILISDKARNTSQHASLLTIQRDHGSIAAPDYRGLPYIAISIDLGAKKTALEVTVDSSKDRDMCMRIHAYGLDATTYPFLNDRAELTRILNELYKRQTPPPSERMLEDLEDQMRFGRSSELRYMNLKKK